MPDLLPSGTPARVAVLYSLLASGWIVLTDTYALWGDRGLDPAWAGSVAKGLLFVAVTGVALFLFLRHEQRRHADLAELGELRWRAALQNAGHGLWDWDIGSGDAFLSSEWKRMLGYADDEVSHRFSEWESRLHPDDREATLAALRAHLEGGATHYDFINRLSGRDGQYRWIRTSGRVVERRRDGRPTRMIGTHTDLTAARESADKTADELALNRAIFDNSPAGIISYRADGQAESANAAAARIVGGTVAQLLAQNFRRIPSWQESGMLALAEQALVEGSAVQRELAVKTTFGRELWLAAQFVPFRHRNEQRLLLLMRDVTERHRALGRLKLLEAALEATPAGVVITDATGNIEWTNPSFSRITGYTADEMLGRNPRVLRSGRHGPEFYRAMWDTIGAGQVWSGEIQNQRKDGAIYAEHMTIAPVLAEGGRIGHFVAIKEDITERKLLEQQLGRTQRLESIGLLASGIAHDLNNIFAPILLSIELLKAKYPQADARKTLELVESAGQRGAGIVKQVLTFARGLDGERTELQLRYLLKEMAAMLRETLPRQVAVEIDCERDLPLVHGSSTQLHQVILNLAINARDAMPGGGRLRLGAHRAEVNAPVQQRHPSLRTGTHVALVVSDTGTGIPPDVLEHMFEPFFTTKPRGQGTGLGLSTVYGIVKSHGGAIDVQTAIGAGTTFTVYLPAHAPDPSPSTGADDGVGSGEVSPAQALAGKRVLVVDDEETIRLLTLRSLQRHGLVVDTAVDGAEAWEILQKSPRAFDAVVTDIMMPRMNGHDLIARLRRLDPSLPVLATTGVPDESGSRPPLEGRVATLRKPYTENELLSALRQLCAASGQKKG